MAHSNTQPVVLLVDASSPTVNQWQSAVEAYPGFHELGYTIVTASNSEEVRYSFSKGTENIALVVLGDENLPYGGTFDEPFPYHHYQTTASVAEYLCSDLVNYSGTIIAASQYPKYCEKIVRAAGNVQTINSYGDRAAIPSLIFEALKNRSK